MNTITPTGNILQDLTAAGGNAFAKPDETKADAFRRLATSRTNVVLDNIRILGNLASPNYEYTEAQVDKIIGALSDALANLDTAFRLRNSKPKGFAL